MQKIFIVFIIVASLFFIPKAKENTFVNSSYAETKSSTVLICNSSGAYAFHTHVCSGLDRCKSEIYRVNLSEAQSSGYKACKICY